jgi:subtilisin family serine protease
VKVLDRRGSGSYSGVIAGVDYVAANASPGDAANMSLGGPVSTALDQAVLNAASKGIKFAIAAGNESQDANNSSPARVNHQNVFTISAIDQNDVFASFSNYGNPPVDYAAPGVSIFSLYKGGGTTTMSGTSMASPHVCGLLLMGSIHSDGFAVGDPDGNPDPIAHH